MDQSYMIDISEELLNIKDEMKTKTVAFKNHEPKKMKQLRRRYQELCAEIKRLNPNSDIQILDELNKINKISDSLNLLLSSLEELCENIKQKTLNLGIH